VLLSQIGAARDRCCRYARYSVCAVLFWTWTDREILVVSTPRLDSGVWVRKHLEVDLGGVKSNDLVWGHC